MSAGFAKGNEFFDLTPLWEVFEGDEVALFEFVIDALAELEASLLSLTDAVAARDVPTALALAHALKGGANNIGAASLATAMTEAEHTIAIHGWMKVDGVVKRGAAGPSRIHRLGAWL